MSLGGPFAYAIAGFIPKEKIGLINNGTKIRSLFDGKFSHMRTVAVIQPIIGGEIHINEVDKEFDGDTAATIRDILSVDLGDNERMSGLWDETDFGALQRSVKCFSDECNRKSDKKGSEGDGK